MTAENAPTSRRAKKERKKSLFWLSEAQAALSWSILLTLAALVGAIYLYQTSRIATAGRHVQILQNQLDRIKQENIELERDIAEAQALDRLQQDAVELGFARSGPSEVEYLVVPDFPPEQEIEATPAPADQVEPAENMVEALWLAIRNSIGDPIHGESR